MHHWQALYNWLSYITIHIKYKREVIFQNDQIKPLTLIKSEASSISRQEDLIMLLIRSAHTSISTVTKCSAYQVVISLSEKSFVHV